MKLSVKSDYATRAVLELARQHHTAKATRAEDLAAACGIPPNYLVQILIELKTTEIVRSVRGKEGGYLLAKPPAEIRLGDVIRSVHGKVFDTPALADPRCPTELRSAWARLQLALDRTADEISFQRLLDDADEGERMYYI